MEKSRKNIWRLLPLSLKGKGEKVVLAGLVSCVILLLLAMLIQDLFFMDNGKTYTISVIITSPGDRFLKGVAQAALDYNVDIHIVSGYDRYDPMEQIQYLQREIDNKTDGVIIEPVYREDIEAFLDGLKVRPVIISTNQPFSDKKYGGYTGSENEAIGRMLGQTIVQGRYNKECLIICPKADTEYMAVRREALKDVFEEENIPYIIFYCDDDEIQGVVSGRNGSVLIALDETMGLSVCRQARDGDMVFAAGYRPGMRQHLESGKITGLVTYSAFDAGYISVSEAVKAIDGASLGDTILECFWVSKDNMYQPPYVQMLFPLG